MRQAAKTKGWRDRVLYWMMAAIAWLSVLLLLSVVLYVVARGWRPVVSGMASESAANSSPGLLLPFISTLCVSTWSTALALPMGLAVGIYLSEYGQHRPLAARGEALIANLAQIPPIVYGLVGWAALAGRQKPASVSVLIVTLSVWLLPKFALVTYEALKAVPAAFRRDSIALGATRWQTSVTAVLPFAARQIVAGVLKAMARLSGEAAPLILLIGVEPGSDGAAFQPLPYTVYSGLIRHVRLGEVLPFRAALLLLISALALQLAGVLMEPARRTMVFDERGQGLQKRW